MPRLARTGSSWRNRSAGRWCAVVAEEQDLERLRVVGPDRDDGRAAATSETGQQRSESLQTVTIGRIVGQSWVSAGSAARTVGRVSPDLPRSPVRGRAGVQTVAWNSLTTSVRRTVALGVRPRTGRRTGPRSPSRKRVADGQGAGPAGGQVLDRQGVLPGRPAEGHAAGRSPVVEQADLVRSASLPSGLLTRNWVYCPASSCRRRSPRRGSSGRSGPRRTGRTGRRTPGPGCPGRWPTPRSPPAR